jgi:DNA-binding NarL/FixJ family response regulator
VTTFDQDDYVYGALRTGACGFLLKRSGPTLLVEGIRRRPDRELTVARLVARARSNAKIATELLITPGTVKTHLANIQRKLALPNRVAIAAWAWEQGVVR